MLAIGQGHAVHHQLRGIHHVLAVQGGRSLHRQVRVAAYPTRQDQCGRSRGVAVIHLGEWIGCGGQGCGCDECSSGLSCSQVVVAGQATHTIAERDAIHSHQIGSQHIFRVEAGGATDTQLFSTHQSRCDGECWRGCCVAVIHLVRRGDRGGQCSGCDAG